ncbi:hypothetical protein HFP15_16130 [Amycolatopsis sp. K13G38]|uniref:Uncharacterized protein n=1 Tax=Amycolatopsis acididurans TaxID=2724524 RepID=A0ABX1J3Q2_9PSEU|nr:hypothetical protein [Amycolatopsis acididurans]NKQ54411.1 hypothetical protein [Amycolatopsis acididurans]
MDTATAALIDPERQLLGCLLQLPTGPARRVLAEMHANDLADPEAAHVLGLAIEVLARDQDPAPVVLYTHAVTTGQAPGRTRREALAQWLFDTYRDAPPAALAEHLKAAVLEAAWRRALTAHADRLRQAADTAPTDLLRELADDTGAIDDLWRRYRAAAEPTTRLEVAA